MKGTSLFVRIFGLALLLGSLPIINVWPQFQWILFAIVMISIGIPHGAIDHLTSEPRVTKKSLARFLFKYLSLIGLYLLAWWFFPIISLAAFILMSAYHFGQTHFIDRSKKSLTQNGLFVSRGIFVLSVILFGDFSYTQKIVGTILDIGPIQDFKFYLIGGFFAITTSIQWLAKVRFNKIDLIDLLVLPLALYFSPLMLGFVIYFGIWHAFPSMVSEYQFLKKFPRYDTLKKFGIQLLPFTIMSLFGIISILLFAQKNMSSEQLIFVFFVLISVISFPHILYMDRFLKDQASTDQN